MKLIKDSILLGTGQLVNNACSFARNIIIARIISPADYGIASTFAITLSFMEMLSNISTDKLIIQSPYGDQERFLDTIHLLQFARGLATGIVIFLFAGPIASLFNVPEARWAFLLLSLVPLMRGLIHQDLVRFQRNRNYLPYTINNAVANLIVTAVSYPLAMYFRNYGAMLAVILLQVFLNMIGSYLYGERKYRWGYENRYKDSIFSFGWPMIVNGILMFGILQGDRFIIGSTNNLFHVNHYTLTDLGVYSVVFNVLFAFTNLIYSVVVPIFMPILSESQNNRDAFMDKYEFCCQVACILGGTVAIVMAYLGGDIITLMFGKKYSTTYPLVFWLTAMQLVRVIRVGPMLAAMSKGDTRNEMFSNIVRVVGFIGVFFVAYKGLALHYFAFFGFVGEILAFSISIIRLKSGHGITVQHCTNPALITLSTVFLGIVIYQGAGLVTLGGRLALCFTSIFVYSALISKYNESFFRNIRQYMLKPA